MSRTLKDTGERMVPEYHKGRLFYGEHIIRYLSAQEIIKNMVVLDIASGSGYGTKMLAKAAKKVYGVDLSKEAIGYAKEHYSQTNIQYLQGDVTKIPLMDSSVDAVVSFETIEHIKNYKKFLSEVKRVLRPEGIFILSTPNNEEYPETNPFHVHEFSQSELNQLLKSTFSNRKDYFQATWLYTALLDEEKLGEEWQEELLTLQTTPLPPERSVYFFSICSDVKISHGIRPIGALSEYSSIREDEQRILKLKQLSELVDRMTKENKALTNNLTLVANELSLIENSKTWRLRKSLLKLIGRK